MNSLPCLGLPCFPAIVLLSGDPDGRGLSKTNTGLILGEQVLPTDAQGTMTLTLTNVIVGSRYRVEKLSDGSLVQEGDVVASTLALTLNYYQPNQTLVVKIRKGTASPYYKPWDTQVVVGAANQSVFVSQIADE